MDLSHPACLAADGSCAGDIPVDAPIALCERHLALAAEWVDREYGIPDLLPSPCRICGSRLGVRYPSGWICGVCEWRVGEVMDAELPPPRIDVVYYVRLGDRVKIGTTSNPRQRFAAIAHEEVLAFERGGRTLEHRRHLEFAADRLGTSEWFAFSLPIQKHVEAVGGGVETAWDAYARWLSEAIARQG
jgi:hypothetical protein